MWLLNLEFWAFGVFSLVYVAFLKFFGSLLMSKVRVTMKKCLSYSAKSWTIWIQYFPAVVWNRRQIKLLSAILILLISIRLKKFSKKPRTLTKKCQNARMPNLVTTCCLNVDNIKTFKNREEAKSDDKIIESIVVRPKPLQLIGPCDHSANNVFACNATRKTDTIHKQQRKIASYSSRLLENIRW